MYNVGCCVTIGMGKKRINIKVQGNVCGSVTLKRNGRTRSLTLTPIHLPIFILTFIDKRATGEKGSHLQLWNVKTSLYILQQHLPNWTECQENNRIKAKAFKEGLPWPMTSVRVYWWSRLKTEFFIRGKRCISWYKRLILPWTFIDQVLMSLVGAFWTGCWCWKGYR